MTKANWKLDENKLSLKRLKQKRNKISPKM